MRAMKKLIWQPCCTTTGTCCLPRYRNKHALEELLLVLRHFEKLCPIHRFQVDDSSLKSGDSFRWLRSPSCPAEYSEICIKQCFSFPVMFAPSLRVLHIAPHPSDSGRSLPVPEHAIQSRAVRDVTSPGHASPSSKSPTRRIDSPITFL